MNPTTNASWMNLYPTMRGAQSSIAEEPRVDTKTKAIRSPDFLARRSFTRVLLRNLKKRKKEKRTRKMWLVTCILGAAYSFRVTRKGCATRDSCVCLPFVSNCYRHVCWFLCEYEYRCITRMNCSTLRDLTGASREFIELRNFASDQISLSHGRNDACCHWATNAK